MATIKDERLQNVVTEFDAGGVTLDGEIVDPFLISVLKDKRRNYKLSDIIKTIQGNQNEILERPIDENFIVQGCAGSGKTMILLHRLSYLAFNYPKTDFSKYVVLTPNESFNRHIDELCEQLEIGSISRMTVESYYLRLGRLLTRNDVQTPMSKKGGKRTKISFDDERLVSEASLDKEYLREVYSRDFAERVISLLEDGKDLVLDEFSSAGITDMLSAKGHSVDVTVAPYVLYNELMQVCRRIDEESRTSQQRVQEKQDALEAAAEELDKVSSAYSSAVKILDPLSDAVIKKSIPSFRKKTEYYRREKAELSNAKKRLKTAENSRDASLERISELKNTLESLRDEWKSVEEHRENLASLEAAKEDSSLQETARKACNFEISAIEELQAQLESSGILSFAKKRQLRENLAKAEAAYQVAFAESLDAAAEDYIASQKEIYERKLAGIEAGLAIAEQKLASEEGVLTSVMERVSQHEEEVKKRQARVSQAKSPVEVLKSYINAFEADRYPNFSKLVDGQSIEDFDEELDSDLFAYLQEFRKLSLDQTRYLRRGEDRVRILSENLEVAKEELEKAKAAVVTDVDADLLQKAQILAEEFDVLVFKDLVDGELRTLRKRYGVAEVNGGSYRHDIYIKLLLCAFYYGEIPGKGISVSIDEAQDLALAEYDLLRRILGSEAVINLYGDTQQLICPYKGVSNWKSIHNAVPGKVYRLNENYRNTLQVSAYCNKRLKMKTTAVGLNGSEVKKESLRDAIEDLFALRSAKEGFRCAIIYKKGLVGIRAKLDGLLGRDASLGYVDTEKISVIPVEAAKGLEFDAVVVIDNDMAKSELYISFTRALDNLFVTSIPGLHAGGKEELAVSDISIDGTAEQVVEINPKSASEPEKRASAEETKDELEDDPFSDFDFN